MEMKVVRAVLIDDLDRLAKKVLRAPNDRWVQTDIPYGLGGGHRLRQCLARRGVGKMNVVKDGDGMIAVRRKQTQD